MASRGRQKSRQGCEIDRNLSLLEASAGKKEEDERGSNTSALQVRGAAGRRSTGRRPPESHRRRLCPRPPVHLFFSFPCVYGLVPPVQ